MIHANTILLEVLKEQYGLYLRTSNEKEFELQGHPDSIPLEISQLSIRMAVDSPYHTINSITGQVIAEVAGRSIGSYTFLASAEGQLTVMLQSFLEKKRYKEFSKTFDKEVESELDKR